MKQTSGNASLLIFIGVLFGCLTLLITLSITHSEKSAPPQVAHTEQPVAAKSIAKNVILLIGDGMGFNQMEAGSFYRYGHANGQAYRNFPMHLSMSTYLASGNYDPDSTHGSFAARKDGATDSAAAATALACGKKTYRYGVGVDCQRHPLCNIVEKAEDLGMSTGVVTSVPFSHATPAGFVAHNVTRRNYEEMARDILLQSSIDVIMGCGHPEHDDNGRFLEHPVNYQYVGGETIWHQLQLGTAGNDADHDGIDDSWTLIESRQAFRQLRSGSTPKRVLGVARVAETLQQKRHSLGEGEYGGSDESAAAPYATPLIDTVPTLTEMAGAAINVLDDNPRGFFLMIEGGAIDWAGHANQSGRLIEEQVAFDDTVDAVLQWVEQNSSWDETLVIITADHETGYLTGPHSDPQLQPLVNNGAGQLPGMEWHSGGHTNSLVPLFARGRQAEHLTDYIVGHDSQRGDFVDNTALFPIMLQALGD